MLAVLSPAKTLDYDSTCPNHRPTQPRFLDDSAELIETIRKRSRPQLRELMGISEKLADLNFQRYKEWGRPFSEENARAAILAFKGDVYTGFDFSSVFDSRLSLCPEASRDTLRALWHVATSRPDAAPTGSRWEPN